MSRKKRLNVYVATAIAIVLLCGVIISCIVAESDKEKLSTRASLQSGSVALFDYFLYQGEDDYYTENPLTGESSFYNPVLPGWYSDPSICTNGEGDYFLVTSTFVYFPGVPLFHSRDLVNWRQVGNVLDREEQLAGMEGQGVSEGIFAPAISYNPHNKTYYMITTNVGNGCFVVKTEDPFGSWSDPIRLPEVGGIDPSLFFDDDGRAYIVNNDDAPGGKPEYDGHRTIRIREYDTERDRTVAGEKILVNKGARPEDNPIWIEGPHMYKIGGKYFLMSAEGGTGEGHSEVIFRGDSPWGPFEPWEGNPILTQRQLAKHENAVTCAGHADLVQTAEGDWWAVFLACRPLDEGFENLGRETFLMPVRWTDDGFPYLTQGDELVPLTLEREGVSRDSVTTFGNFSVLDDFDEEELGMEWMTLRSSAKDLYSLTAQPGSLSLECAPVASTEKLTPALVCRRVQHHKFQCQTRMTFTPSQEGEAAGLLLFKDETHQYFMALSLAEDGSERLTLWKTGREGNTALAEARLETKSDTGDEAVGLRIVSHGETFDFYYSTPAGHEDTEWTLLAGGVDASYLSTALTGGFTGTVAGMYATSLME